MSHFPERSLRAGLGLSGHLLRRRPAASQWMYLLSLLFSVVLVAGMMLFTARVEQAIYRENAALLAADLQIESSRPVHASRLHVWSELAKRYGLRWQESVELASMLYFDGELLLSRVLAVEPDYPLRGQLQTASALGQSAVVTSQGPSRGSIWLDERAARQLGATIGDSIELGHLSLTFSAVLGAEPGVVLPSLGLAGNAMFNIGDLAATRLIVPGSRASWRFLFAGEQAAVDALAQELRPQLASHQRMRGNNSGDDNTSRVIERALDYLNLGAGVALLMAMLACLVAGQQFIAAEQASVVILKALGFTRRALTLAYALLFTLWWAVSTALGCGLAYLLVTAGFAWFAPNLDIPAVSPALPFLFAAIVALGVAASFVLPALYTLANIAPQRLLRQAQSSTPVLSSWLLLPLAALLLSLLGGSLLAGVALLLATLALAVCAWLLVRGVMLALAGVMRSETATAAPAGANWRFGVQAFLRQRQASEMRVVALATTLALLCTIVGLRGSLLEAWRAELPADAPNFFAVNIPAERAAAFEQWLKQHNYSSQGAFPVARARLLQVNNESVQSRIDLHPGNARSLGREFVMTESVALPVDNLIVDGHWHAERPLAEVSVESGIAERLDLALGDRLLFSFGGQEITLSISSVRSLKWETMQPNFYFITSVPVLATLPHSYMASFYMPAGRDAELAEFVAAFPAMTLIDLAALIDQIERVVSRAALAVEVLALLTLCASVLVVATSLRASLQVRLQEQRLLRALGATASALRKIAWYELALSGVLAGVVGSVAGSAMLYFIAVQGFGLTVYPSLSTLLLFTAVPALLVVLLGELMLASAYRVSPLAAWRK